MLLAIASKELPPALHIEATYNLQATLTALMCMPPTHFASWLNTVRLMYSSIHPLPPTQSRSCALFGVLLSKLKVFACLQPLHSRVSASHDPNQPQAIPVTCDSNLPGSEPKPPIAQEAILACWVLDL